MPLWGTSATKEFKPSYLTETQKESCYATKSGWCIKRKDGTEEVLVAIKGLSLAGRLGNASITEVKFGSGVYTAGAVRTIKVSFDEKVTVTGVPTIDITKDTGGVITATYASTNTAGNTLTFEFTVPAAATVLSVVTQSVLLAGGTIVETGVAGPVNASLVVSAAALAATGTKTAV